MLPNFPHGREDFQNLPVSVGGVFRPSARRRHLVRKLIAHRRDRNDANAVSTNERRGGMDERIEAPLTVRSRGGFFLAEGPCCAEQILGKSMSQTIEIAPETAYVIDDSADMRRSLHFLLGTIGITSRPFASCEDFLEAVSTLSEAPILLDLRMPRMDGIQLMAQLKARQIGWPVIIMTAHGDVAVAVRAMKLGAIEFLEKPFESDDLEVSLKRALAAVADHRQSNAVRAVAAERLARLTPRETDVVGRLAEGTLSKVIAHDMGLSARTVEMHRANALVKLGVKNLVELIALLKDAAPGG
jgi:two-component system response regulator FixJ